MSRTFTYKEGATVPNIELWWRDSAGDLIDFASGYTFTVTVATDELTTAEINTTAGVTGAAGTGTESEGTPNVTISPSGIGLDDLEVPSGCRDVQFELWLKAVNGSAVRDYPEELFVVLEARPPTV